MLSLLDIPWNSQRNLDKSAGACPPGSSKRTAAEWGTEAWVISRGTTDGIPDHKLLSDLQLSINIHIYIYIYIYIHTYIHTYIYIHIYIYTYLCIYVCMYVCMHVCMYVCMYAWMYVCMYVCMCICIYIYICMYVCMYVCKYLLSIFKSNALLATFFRYGLDKSTGTVNRVRMVRYMGM